MNEAARGRLRRTTSGRRPRKRTPSTTSQQLVWTCDECGRPIRDGDGWVTIGYADIRAYRVAAADWERRHPRGDGWRILSLGEYEDFPNPVRWHVWHRRCDPDITSEDYFIDIDRIRTVAQLLEWSSHLMEKTWFANTTWKDVLRGQANQLGRTG